jgi:hypothetical protein
MAVGYQNLGRITLNFYVHFQGKIISGDMMLQIFSFGNISSCMFIS